MKPERNKQKRSTVTIATLILSGIFAGVIAGPVFLYATENIPPTFIIDEPDSDNFIDEPDTPFTPSEPPRYLPAGEYTAGPDGVLSPLGPGEYTVGPDGTAIRVLPPTASETKEGVAKAAADKAAADQAAEMAKAFSCIGGGWTSPLSFNLKGCVANLMDMVMWIAARTLWIAGVLLNMTLHLTLNLDTLLKQLPIVDIGWKVLRDIANIVFIFITLWAGISITLGIGDGGKKAWGLLAQMVLVALFINFSLFITKAIVDASNIAALHFYSLIVEPGKEKDFDSGLSEAFMYGLKLSTLYNAKQIGSGAINADASMIATASRSSGLGKLSFTNIILIGFFGSLFIVVAAWVFFAAAIMFIYRAVTLIFLMLLSPLAFVGLILPGASGMAHQWWSKLWSQAFFAPLYLALAYVVVRTINGSTFQAFQGTLPGSTPGTGFAAALTTTSFGPVSVIFNFVILIGLMVACLIVAQSLGAKGSEMAMAGWEKIKGAAVGVAGATVRGTIKAPSAGIRALGNTGAARAATGRWMANTRLLHGGLLKNTAFSKWAANRGTNMERRGQEIQTGRAGLRRWTNRIGNAVDARYLEERAGQSVLGQTTIGKGIRAVTTGALANLKIGGKSLEEAHKESEEQRTARHVISSITQVRNAESDLRPLREQQNQHQEGVHEAQAEQESARQELAQAQAISPQQQQEIDAAQAELTRVSALQPSAQQQQQIAALQHDLILAQQDLAADQATITSQQQGAIAAAQAELTQAEQGLAQNPADVIQQEIVRVAQQRLAQARTGSPQQQRQIAAAQAELTQAEQAFAAAQATIASQQQGAIAAAQAALTTAHMPRPLTTEQQAAINTAQQALATAETNLAGAERTLREFSARHTAEINALTRRKSEAYAAISPAEYVKYAPKTDIIHNMEFGDTPLSIYNAVIADEHRLNEHEKEEATNNFLRRVNEAARRGGARTQWYHDAIITIQRELNRFGSRREQILGRMAPQLRADLEQAETREREILERLARMAQTTQGAVPPPPAGGTQPPGNRRP